MIKSYDFLVIGGGSAGYAAARTAKEFCSNVAIVDAGSDLGGLCILRGCMPSKTVIYSAEVLHLAQNAQKFGLEIPSAKVDMPAIKARKKAMVEDFASYRREQLQSDRFELFRQKAHFIDTQTVELEDGQQLRAKKIFIATGSQPKFPNIPGLLPENCWISDDILDLDFLPESVIVLGGGVVACELAQYLNRIGSKVIQIQRSPQLLKETSPAASKIMARVFRDEGIELYLDTQLERIVKSADGTVSVDFQHQGKAHKVSAAHLFNALGRKANTDGLLLGAAKVKSNKRGQITVDDWQQTSNPDIYAGGDVTGPHEIVHLAVLQGELAARHAFGEPAEKVRYDQRTGVVFTDPQIASVGLSVEEAKNEGMDIVCADYPFDDHGKSILMEARYGYVKVWAERGSGRLVGAECVGKDAGELIHSMAVGVSLQANVKDMLQTQWYHPTLSEIWSYPLEDLLETKE